MPIASDLAEYFRQHGVRAHPAAGVQPFSNYFFIERISYTGTSAALAAPSVAISTPRWIVRQTVPVYGAAIAIVSSVDVGEVANPGDTLTIALVGGGNSTVDGWALPREVFEQWHAARNRPLP